MPRMARIVLCGHPHHVVQRGHNRQATFANVPDYTRYLATLQEYKVEYRVKVLAWCLMTNHVHLILVPGDKGGLGKLMKRLAGRQTRHHNKLECRSSTLWEGRYKSSLVQQDSYLRARVVVISNSIQSAPRWLPRRKRIDGRVVDHDLD